MPQILIYTKEKIKKSKCVDFTNIYTSFPFHYFVRVIIFHILPLSTNKRRLHFVNHWCIINLRVPPCLTLIFHDFYKAFPYSNELCKSHMYAFFLIISIKALPDLKLYIPLCIDQEYFIHSKISLEEKLLSTTLDFRGRKVLFRG